MLVARATMGLFWASNFADDEKHFHVMVGLSGKRRGERAHNKRGDNIQEGSHLIFSYINTSIVSAALEMH